MTPQGTDFATYLVSQNHREYISDEELLREELGLPETLAFAHDAENHPILPEYFEANFNNFLENLKELISQNGPINLVFAANGAIPILERLLEHLESSGFTDWNKINLIFSTKAQVGKTGEEAYEQARTGDQLYEISQGKPNNLPIIMVDDLLEYGGAGDSTATALETEGFKITGGFLRVYAPGYKRLSREDRLSKKINKKSNLVLLPSTLEFKKEWLLGAGLDGDVYENQFLTREELLRMKVYERLAKAIFAKRKDIDIAGMTEEEVMASVDEYLLFLSKNSFWGELTPDQLEGLPIYQLLYALDSVSDATVRISILKEYFDARINLLKGPQEG